MDGAQLRCAVSAGEGRALHPPVSTGGKGKVSVILIEFLIDWKLVFWKYKYRNPPEMNRS